MNKILVTRFLDNISKNVDQKAFRWTIQKKWQEGKKEKNTKMAIAKLLAFHANAII